MKTPIVMKIVMEGQISDMESIKKAHPKDEIRFERKDNGKTITARCVKRDGDKLYFVTDIVDRLPMRTRAERCTWRDCHVRAVITQLAEKVLPDELLSIVIPRTIKQYIGGEEIITEDKFWIPSSTEVGEKAACDPDDEAVFESIENERDRIMVDEDGETWWYWLRSAYSANNFRYVSNNGNLYNYNASYTHGVVLGFCIDL